MPGVLGATDRSGSKSSAAEFLNGQGAAVVAAIRTDVEPAKVRQRVGRVP